MVSYKYHWESIGEVLGIEIEPDNKHRSRFWLHASGSNHDVSRKNELKFRMRSVIRSLERKNQTDPEKHIPAIKAFIERFPNVSSAEVSEMKQVWKSVENVRRHNTSLAVYDKGIALIDAAASINEGNEGHTKEAMGRALNLLKDWLNSIIDSKLEDEGG